MSDTPETAEPVDAESGDEGADGSADHPERKRVGSAWSRLELLGSGLGVVAADREPAPAVIEPERGERGLHVGGGVVGEPLGPAVSPAHRGFAIVHVGLFDDDRVWARSRERLSADIYTRQVALRYAGAKAKAETEGSYFALVDPNGRCAGVFTTGSGRVTGPETTKRVKSVLARSGQTRKRTSRPSKRTSKRSP
jgi:hypothetical protein